MEENKGIARLKNDIQTGQLQNIYIFHGEETYLRSNYLQKVRKALIPAGFEEFNDHPLSGKGLTIQTLSETVEAMPMMAQHTLVTVEDMDLFKLDEGQRKALIALLEDFPEYCTLIFIYHTLEYKPDKRVKKLYTALEEHVCVVKFAQQERSQLIRWLQRRFAARGHSIDPSAADHLMFTCGTLMSGLLPEVEKVAAYAKGEAITIEDINAVAEPILSARVFDMTDAITARRFDDAMQILSDLLRMQTEPIAILAAVGKELRKLYTARMALDNGKDRFWLKQLWHMSSDYPAKLLLQAAKKVDHQWCRDAMQRCQSLDRRMKSQRGIDNEAELKLFLTELAGAR